MEDLPKIEEIKSILEKDETVESWEDRIEVAKNQVQFSFDPSEGQQGQAKQVSSLAEDMADLQKQDEEAKAAGTFKQETDEIEEEPIVKKQDKVEKKKAKKEDDDDEKEDEDEKEEDEDLEDEEEDDDDDDEDEEDDDDEDEDEDEDDEEK
jgi:hypothetical protein